MEELVRQLQEAVKKERIDLIGFAPKSRFEGVPAHNNPFSIFPEGETVILIGKRICRGSLRGVEEGTNFGDYSLFGKNWLEDEFLSLACYNVVGVLEDNGWEACPVFPNPPEMRPTGVAVREGQAEPNVVPDFDYAAVACGLAELSLSGLAMTPKFGTRQRFHMIITDAVLPATPILEQKICDRCGKCAAACPLGAIHADELTDVTICGKTMQVAKVDYDKCRVCKNGACVNRLADYAKPDRIAALCNRTCLVHLEETDATENKFETPFRKREAWALDSFGNWAGRDTASANVLGGSFSKDGDRRAK